MSTAEKQTHRGCCHCQAVQFTVQVADPTRETNKQLTCDCSHCSKKGIIWGFAEAGEFKLDKGADSLTAYEFGPKNMKHLFCKTCGTTIGSSHSPNEIGEGAKTGYNILCVRDFDPHAITYVRHNGAKIDPQYPTPVPLEATFPPAEGKTILHGSCHCQAVKYAVQYGQFGTEGAKLVDCNCSWDGANGITGIYPLEADYALSPDADSHLTVYTRPDGFMGIGYRFCKTCGCTVYGKAADTSKTRNAGYGDAALNVRLLDVEDVWTNVVDKAYKVNGRDGWGGKFVVKD